MKAFKVYLITVALLCLIYQAVPALAQAVVTGAAPPAAIPVAPVAEEPLKEVAAATGPIVIELFSSQACIFCPGADRLFADLAAQENVVGIACHVDYFDVREGALSKPFCTARQGWYQKILHGGPHYTPQMVIQGTIDVVGYKLEDVYAGMKKTAETGTAKLQIFPGKKPNEYRVALPDDFAMRETGAVLWLMTMDAPHDIAIAEGRNRGRRAVYVNIVSDMKGIGPWPPGQQGTVIEAPFVPGQENFAVLLQDSVTGKIIAAAKYKKTSAPKPN
ncbi:MAG TPA: DUF1223 domain-containing protein [Alphaproteobacteria bacterium]